MKLKRLGKDRVMFKCPGCGMVHQVTISGEQPKPWWFNRDFNRPTFRPSIKVELAHDENRRPIRICHFFVKDGEIRFLPDCFHHLAGKTVELPEWENNDDDE